MPPDLNFVRAKIGEACVFRGGRHETPASSATGRSIGAGGCGVIDTAMSVTAARNRRKQGAPDRPPSIPERRQAEREKRQGGREKPRAERPAAFPVEVRRVQQQVEHRDGGGDERRGGEPSSPGEHDEADWRQRDEGRNRQQPAIRPDEDRGEAPRGRERDAEEAGAQLLEPFSLA